MQSPQTAATVARQSRLLTFARAHDAQLYATQTLLTSDEAKRLRATLDQLVEIGSIALYRLGTPIEEAADWQQLVTVLQSHIGALCFDAAISAADHPATTTPKPRTLVPVWEFEHVPNDAPTLTAYGLFMGAPIAFEALPMVDGDPMRPSPAVASRYAAWRAAAEGGALIGTVALPSRDAPFAIFASVRAG